MSRASGLKAVNTGQLAQARSFKKLRRAAIRILEREMNAKDVLDLANASLQVLGELQGK